METNTEPESLYFILKIFWWGGLFIPMFPTRDLNFKYSNKSSWNHRVVIFFFFNVYQFYSKAHIIVFVKLIYTFLFMYSLINNYLLGAFYVSRLCLELRFWCLTFPHRVYQVEISLPDGKLFFFHWWYLFLQF